MGHGYMDGLFVFGVDDDAAQLAQMAGRHGYGAFILDTSAGPAVDADLQIGGGQALLIILRLQQDVAAHRQRMAYRAAVPAPQEGGISWRWSLAATVPLLTGVLATILWRRSHRSNEQLVSTIVGR